MAVKEMTELGGGALGGVVGGKGIYYNASVVLRNAPDIMGLDLVRKNSGKSYQWVGAYRLDGSRCGHRKDKLKVFAWKGAVWVCEEGEPAISIQRWLVEYGGCADYRNASRVLRLADPARRIQECVINMQARCKEGAYVSEGEWVKFSDYDLDRCNLYTWMCSMFGEDSARGAFERYKVTTNSRGEVVYWYIDIEGRICHDKVMAYKTDGHRDKNRGGWRKFTNADGYTNRCYFGSHLLADAEGKRVMVVEGEKTALMCSIVFPEYVWIATGGKNQLRDVEQWWTLLPDVDAADEWSSKGVVSRWWESYINRNEHSDIGDMIAYAINGGWSSALENEEMQKKLFNQIN